MRNAIESILNAIERDPAGVAVIWCPDYGLRDWLTEQVEQLAPPNSKPWRVSDVESALAEPSRLALLVPDDEQRAVLELDASRDRLLGEPSRTQPVVLFLMRRGDGQRALAEQATSLEGWVHGSDADPESRAEVDIPAQSAAFESRHGLLPEAWLERWRGGELPQTAENFRIADDAMLLEERDAS